MWCQIHCAALTETLTNLWFKLRRRFFPSWGHQGKAEQKGVLVCKRRTVGPNPWGSLSSFLCHMQLFKPGFHFIKAFDLINPFFTEISFNPNLLFVICICQWVCVMFRRLQDIAVLLFAQSTLWRGILCCTWAPARVWWMLKGGSSRRGASACPVAHRNGRAPWKWVFSYHTSTATAILQHAWGPWHLYFLKRQRFSRVQEQESPEEY